jgi:hypothetical protein
VQFVPYSQFARQGIPYLAKEVLAEVPGQVHLLLSIVCCLKLKKLVAAGCWLLAGFKLSLVCIIPSMLHRMFLGRSHPS